MNSTTRSQQKDMFERPPVTFTPLHLEIRGIPAPRLAGMKKGDKLKKPTSQQAPNFHIPSFKNAKRWITKLPNGKPLERPFLITSPEFQKWMEKAVQLLESQLLSACQTEHGAIPLERSKLSAMLSRLPADDSVNDLTEGSWKVEFVNPGEEGCLIEITRLS